MEILAIILIGFVIYKLTSKKKPKKSTAETPTKKQKPQKQVDSLLYKKKETKYFDLKGLSYNSLNPEKHNGFFIGYAECTYHKKDTYSVGVFNSDKKLLGYIPKGNKRLHKSLKEWHKGKIFAWGTLRHDYDNHWYGHAHIPIGAEPEELNNIKNLLELAQLNKDQIKLKKKETDYFFDILKRYKTITSLQTKTPNYPEASHENHIPFSIIPSISKHLETEKNWEKLIELENYPELIEPLAERLKNSTLKRIEKAKEHLTTPIK